MRRLLVLSFLLLTAAKGKPKKGAEAPPPPPPPPEVTEPAPAPEPEPEESAVPKNVSFNVTITFSDGTTKAGHVSGLERTADFYGDEGWTTDERKLKVTLEVGTSEREVAWTDIASVTIVPGKVPSDVDCSYSSATTPVMYDCTLRTTSTAKLKDGTAGMVATRHQWKLYFDDGSTQDVQLYKYTARQPETNEENPEEAQAYMALQERIGGELKTVFIKSITIQ